MLLLLERPHEQGAACVCALYPISDLYQMSLYTFIWAVLWVRTTHLCLCCMLVIGPVALCVFVSVWVSTLEPLRVRRRHLSQHDTVRRDPPLPLAPTLPTWNLNLSPTGAQARVFQPVYVWDMLPHSMCSISAIKAVSFSSGCTPFRVHKDRGPTGGSTSALGLEVRMLKLSVTLLDCMSSFSCKKIAFWRQGPLDH